MENSNNKNHWENIYQTKSMNEVSWYQTVPETSLAFFQQFNLAKNASIIDIGGGDSFLVDNLLKLGYTNVSVLDISASALERAKERLGDSAKKVKWIVSDIVDFIPTEKYDVWHDRAAFHFLTTNERISKYISITENNISIDGYLIIGTFSENGPKKCSGLEIHQYNEASMSEKFSKAFQKLKCTTENHTTPFDTIQNFQFCSFKRENR